MSAATHERERTAPAGGPTGRRSAARGQSEGDETLRAVREQEPEEYVQAPSGLYTPPAKELRYKDAGAKFRAQSSIQAFVGPNGGGKSLCAVHQLIPALEAGRTVLSTVKLLDPLTGEAHPSYVRLTDWNQIMDAEHCHILLDEVVGIANARASQGMPVQVQNLLVQLRRRDIVLLWTAPNFARADVILREVTQAVTVCKGYMGKDYEAGSGAELKAWRQKRLFRWKTYSAVDFSTMSDSKTVKIGAEKSAWFWGPGSKAFHSYDTLDSVERVGEVLDSGTCAHCGGFKKRKPCSCPDAHDHE